MEYETVLAVRLGLKSGGLKVSTSHVWPVRWRACHFDGISTFWEIAMIAVNHSGHLSSVKHNVPLFKNTIRKFATVESLSKLRQQRLGECLGACNVHFKIELSIVSMSQLHFDMQHGLFRALD